MPAGLLPAGTEGIVGSSCVVPRPSQWKICSKIKIFSRRTVCGNRGMLSHFFLVPEPMIYDLQLQPTLLQK